MPIEFYDHPSVLSSLMLISNAVPFTIARSPIMLLSITQFCTCVWPRKIELRTTLPIIVASFSMETLGPTTASVMVTFSPIKHGGITTLLVLFSDLLTRPGFVPRRHQQPYLGVGVTMRSCAATIQRPRSGFAAALSVSGSPCVGQLVSPLS